MRRWLVLALCAAGCGDASSGAARDAALRDGGAADAAAADGAPADAPSSDAASCRATSSSMLDALLGDAVEIRIHGPCSFTLAQARAGISIPYDIIVRRDVPGVVAATQDAGRCDRPDASGLIPFEELSGAGQRYCLCDRGFCAPPSSTPVTLRAGTTSGAFAWDGVNWTGPSDTGNPKGAPFPAGDYTLRVSVTGTVGGTPFRVAATYPVMLTP